jgi:cytosine deaminase
VERATYDAARRLVCGGLVETHIHLDKAHLLDRRPAQAGRNINPVPYASAIKPEISKEDGRNASFEARHIFEPKWRSIP